MPSMPSKGERDASAPARKGPRKPDRLKPSLLSIAAIIAVVLGVAAFAFLGGEPKGAVIEIEAPEKAGLGEMFDIQVVFKNESQSVITDTSVSLALPKGISFADGEGEARSIREIGDVEPGGVMREAFKLTISEGADTEKTIKAEANYIPGGVSQHISIKKEKKIIIQKPVTVSLEFPEKAVSGEEFDWTVVLTNSSDNDLKVKVSAEADGGMTTDFKPFEATVAKGEEVKKKFGGSVVLAEGEPFGVKVSISGDVNGTNYLIDEQTVSATVAASPLSVKAEIKGKAADFTAIPGDKLDYVVTVKNNSDVPLQNVMIRGMLKGAMYNLDSITTNGMADRSAQLVTWDMSTNDSLREITPGASQSFDLSVLINNDYPIKRLSDRNFSVELALRAESPTVPYFVKSLKTVNIASLKTKIAGQLAVEAAAYFRDAASGIVNDGNLPFTVGNLTESTVHWTVTSYSTDMENVEIRAELPPGVELTGEKKVSVGDFSFSNDSREAIWRIPKVLATTGVLSNPIEAIFQISITPLSAHMGGYMAILGDTNVFATDAFTGQKVQSIDAPLTSEFTDDRTVGPNDGIVR